MPVPLQDRLDRHLGDVSKANGRIVSQFPIMIRKSPHGENVISNPNCVLCYYVMCNQGARWRSLALKHHREIDQKN